MPKGRRQRPAADQTPKQSQEFHAQTAHGNADVDAGETSPPELPGLEPVSLVGFLMYYYHQPHPPEKAVAGA
jgi:hypothetical protein